MLAGAARKHRAIFEKMVEEVGVTLTVRQPKGRSASTTDVDKVFGSGGANREQEIDPAQNKDVKVVWSTDYHSIAASGRQEILSALGGLALHNNQLDVIIRLKLEDGLVDPNQKHGKTIFETSHDVLYGGLTYKVKGTARTGFPPEGPYILWVGLVREA